VVNALLGHYVPISKCRSAHYVFYFVMRRCYRVVSVSTADPHREFNKAEQLFLTVSCLHASAMMSHQRPVPSVSLAST